MSILEARLTKSTETGSEHILLALLKEKNTLIHSILMRFHLDYSSAFLYVKSILDTQPDDEEMQMPQSGANFTDDDEEEMRDKSSFNPRRTRRGGTNKKRPIRYACAR